ncbi:MAG: hypothetical protein E7Z63_06485 [Thermoplasmata archaeon]|nr:hypothetical protein [Thermoplasmata archaeon]
MPNSKIILAIVCIVAVAVVACVVVLNMDDNSKESKSNPDVDMSDVITASDLEDLKSKAKSDSSTVLDMSNDTASVQFNSDAILALKSAGTFKTSVVDHNTLSEADRAAVGDMPVYEISFGTNKTFGEGTATVTLPYTPGPGEDTSKVYVACIVNGDLEKFEASYSNGKVTFSTTHFSLFAVLSEQVCTITFTDGGLTVDTKKVPYGAFIPASTYSPVLDEGDYFCGWIGLTDTTPAKGDASFEISITHSSAALDSEAFSYDGEFGSFAAVSGATVAKAAVFCETDFPMVPENVIKWEVSQPAAASERFNAMSASIKAGQDVMGAKPVQVAIDGYDSILVYKADVSSTFTMTMLYFVALNGEQLVYAASFDDSMVLDKFGGIIIDGKIASDEDIRGVLVSALASIGVSDNIAVGNAANCAATFLKSYNGVYGTFNSGESGEALATVTGNGTITWRVDSGSADLFAAAVDAIAATGAKKVTTLGYENAAMFVTNTDGALNVYFTAYTDSYFLTNTDDSASTYSSAADATNEDAMILFNAALKAFGVNIYLPPSSEYTNDVRICAQTFIDELYDEPKDSGVWDILEGATASEAYLRHTYVNANNATRAVIYHITYEEDIDGAFVTASDLIKSYVGQVAIMGDAKYSLYNKAIGDTDCVAVVYWGSGVSAARFVLTSGNILIDGCLAPFYDVAPDYEATKESKKYAYPYMPLSGTQAKAEPELVALVTAFSTLDEYGRIYNVETSLATSAEWFVENFVNPNEKEDMHVTWTVSDGSKSTSATIEQNLTLNNGRPGHGQVVLTKEEDIDAAYEAALTKLSTYVGKAAGMGNVFNQLDYEFDGIEFSAVGYTNSTALSMKFVMKVDDVLVDGTSPGTSWFKSESASSASEYQDYLYLRAPSASQSGLLENFLKTIISAIREHGSESANGEVNVGAAAGDFSEIWTEDYGAMTGNNKSSQMPASTLTVTESDKTSATFAYTYKNGSNTPHTEYIYVTYENAIASAYNDAVVALSDYEGTIALGSESAGCRYVKITTAIDGVTYYGIMYAKDNSGIGCLKFVTYVGNVLIDASCTVGSDASPYIFLGYDQDHDAAAVTIIKAFHDAFSDIYYPIEA